MEKIIKNNYIKKEKNGTYSIFANEFPSFCRMNGGVVIPTEKLGKISMNVSFQNCNSNCPLFGEKIQKHQTKNEFGIHLKCSNAFVILSNVTIINEEVKILDIPNVDTIMKVIKD